MLARGCLFALLLLAACDESTDDGTGGGGAGPAQAVHLGEVVSEGGEGVAELRVDAPGTLTVHLDGQARIVEVDGVGAESMRFLDGSVIVDPEGEPYDGGAWLRPRPIEVETVELEITGQGTVDLSIWVRGEPAPAVVRERGLFWTQPAIVDDAYVVGLARVLGAASDDGHGGALLDQWLHRFATTLHSERAGPAQLADEFNAVFGSPSAWDLDALPFVVTGVHNRLDLAARQSACGELRVSIASTHAVYAPFHMLFLFEQAPREDDIGPGGTVHCLGTARRWARLSALDEGAFFVAAREILDETIAPDRFLLAETVELTVSPWEWRQWTREDAEVFDNPALFQTVDVTRLNQPGASRDSFLAFVADNAQALDARAMEIPATFRSASARVPPSAPAERLSLEGLDAGVLSTYPDLAEAIEIVGCPTCHTSNVEFVQTSIEREASPFYDLELDARGERLDRLNLGVIEPVPPFGPLQD